MATVLEIAQEVSAEYNLRVPTSLVGSGNAGWLQMFQLINSVGNRIRESTNWQICCRRVEWVSIAGEDQGDIEALCPDALDYIIPESFWDMTERREVYGPISDVQYQQLKALVPSSPLYQYRIQNNRLLIMGPMVVGHDLSLIYKTKYWARATALGAYKTRITADLDVPFFDDRLMVLGLKAFWRKAKQMAWQEEMNQFEKALTDKGSVDIIKRVVRMDNSGERGIRPGIFVPYGNWDLTTLP